MLSDFVELEIKAPSMTEIWEWCDELGLTGTFSRTTKTKTTTTYYHHMKYVNVCALFRFSTSISHALPISFLLSKHLTANLSKNSSLPRRWGLGQRRGGSRNQPSGSTRQAWYRPMATLIDDSSPWEDITLWLTAEVILHKWRPKKELAYLKN